MASGRTVFRNRAVTDLGGGSTDYYRQSRYGSTPDYYVDVTKTTDGDGSIVNPLRVSQAKTVPTSGDLCWWLPLNECANGAIVALTAPQSSRIPAFNPSNSGSSAGSQIIHVTKYAASSLVLEVGKVSIGSDGRRTELRHAGDPATIDAGGAGGTSDTGGPILGAYQRNHIVYDGFYIDMDECEIREDSGLIATNECVGVQVRNLAVKCKTVGIASNCVLYSPHDSVDDVVSNVIAWGFHNSATAGGNQSATPQPALFCDSYGARNFLWEHLDVDDFDRGIFCKGAASFTQPTVLNYGTVQFSRVTNTSYPYFFHAMDGSNVTTVRYCLGDGTYEKLTEPDFAGDGIGFDTITTAQIRNVVFDHVTIARVVNAVNTTAAFFVDPDGSGNGMASEPNGIKLLNSILDIDSGSNVYLISQPSANDMEQCDYNYYRRPNGVIFSRNGSSRTFAQWAADNGGSDAHSDGTTNTDPFMSRSTGDLRVSPTHPAATLSSTGGPVGCYDENNYTIGLVAA